MNSDLGDELFALPLEEFTAARNALASKLHAAGDKDGAARVKKLRKPSLAAWAVNQVARRDRDRVARLLHLRDRMEEASDPDEMRAASEERRKLITHLVGEAASVLATERRSTSAGAMQAITQTFHAGDDDDGRADLLHGRLSRELEPSGFGGVTLAVNDETAVDEAEPDPKMEEKRNRAESLAREADEANAEAERLEKEAAVAERALRSAVAKAESARVAAEEARRNAELAFRELDDKRG